MFNFTKHRYMMNGSFTACCGNDEEGIMYRYACTGCQKVLTKNEKNIKEYEITVAKGGAFVRLKQDKTGNYFDIGFEKYGKVVLYRVVSDLPPLIPHSKLNAINEDLFWNLINKKPISKDLLLMNVHAFEYYYHAHNLPEILAHLYSDEPHDYKIH